MPLDDICVPLAQNGTYTGYTCRGRCRRIAECGVSRQVSNRGAELEIDDAVCEKVLEDRAEGEVDGTSGGQEMVHIVAKVLKESVNQL